MFQGSSVFETHYKDYCRQISVLDFASIADTLGIEQQCDQVRIRFFNRDYWVSRDGIRDASNNRPDYGVCVILAKYILLCPEQIHHDPQWVSFKDFKKNAAFTNINFFTSDTEHAILKHFSGKRAQLLNACNKLGGVPHDIGATYDLSMQLDALPRISLLLLYNDCDEEFPAQCTVLFQKHAEFYLDPKSLVMTSAGLAKQLAQTIKNA